MALYTLEGPDGRRYKIEGPAGATAEQLAAVIQAGNQPNPKRSIGGEIRQQVGNLIAGGVRGAGSIGATILYPWDKAQDLYYGDRDLKLSNLVTGEKPLSRNEERRRAMDEALGTLGAETDSLAFGAGKLATEIAGTAGVGGQVARAATMVPKLAPLAPYIASSGMQSGNLAARAAGGAITGAASAGLVNPQEALFGAIVGGALPPVVSGAKKGLHALGVAARAPVAVARPFTQKGKEDIVAEILQKSATDPQKAAQAMASGRALVPGSTPTVAQIANDPGLAQLERSLVNNPELAAPLQQRYAAQRAARMSALDNVAGTDDYFEAIKEGRRIFANEDYAKAIAQGIDQDVAVDLAPQIQSLMERPSIQQAQRIAKDLAKEAGDDINDFGSVKGLDYLKKALDEQISAAKKPGSSIGDTKLRALVQTKDDLMLTLEQIAPGYKEANDNFAKMSRQVNSMEVARDLRQRFEPALNRFGASGKELANEYAKALEAATSSVKRSAGVDKPLSSVMGTRDIAALEGVAQDLARKNFVENAGKAAGSPTAQNVISQSLIDRLSSQLGLPQSVAQSGAAQVFLSPYQGLANLSGATQSVNDLLTASLLDPAMALGLLSRPPAQGLLAPAAQQAPRGQGLLGLAARTAPILVAQ
ncbi:MAG TPA: hypothetical protein VMA55_11135 [Acidovorax sp.]|nr:hypothetical protein [Acidovorax sp.]